MENKEMEITFTSFRDSMTMDGLKVSIEKRAPSLCSHPTLSFLIMPEVKNLKEGVLEKICTPILDNNRDLINEFLEDIYELGIKKLIICCWCTRTQIANEKPCVAKIVGNYIKDIVALNLDFPVVIAYKDGRETL